MILDADYERDRLGQSRLLEVVTRQVSPAEMLIVYANESGEYSNCGFYCALIPNDHIEDSLKKISWDLSIGDGLPGIVEYFQVGKIRRKYARFGGDDGIEPLAIRRDFHGLGQC